MNESQLLKRIQTVAGPDNRALLARFWLLMDARPVAPPFTFSDFRHLDAEARSVFHSIFSSYSRDQFAPLNAELVSSLRQLTVPRGYRDAVPHGQMCAMHYYPAQESSSAAMRPTLPEGVMT